MCVVVQVAARSVVEGSERGFGPFLDHNVSSAIRSNAPLELGTPFAGMPSASLLSPDGSTEKPEAFPWWLTSKLFALTSDGNYLVSGGFWDSSFKLHALNNGSVVQSIASHSDVVSCLALASLANVQAIATSSRDDPYLTPHAEARRCRVSPCFMFAHLRMRACLSVTGSVVIRCPVHQWRHQCGKSAVVTCL